MWLLPGHCLCLWMIIKRRHWMVKERYARIEATCASQYIHDECHFTDDFHTNFIISHFTMISTLILSYLTHCRPKKGYCQPHCCVSSYSIDYWCLMENGRWIFLQVLCETC
jgi:hypothetical protein